MQLPQNLVMFDFSSFSSFPPVAVAVREHDYGQRIGLISVSRLQCSGSEERLTDCRSFDLRVGDCGYLGDAGVFCLPRTSTGTYL